MGDEQEFYENVCKPNFESLQTDTKEILRILKGSNGDTPGLCERVRDMEKGVRTFKKIVGWAGGILGGTWIVSNAVVFFEWIGKVIGGK